MNMAEANGALLAAGDVSIFSFFSILKLNTGNSANTFRYQYTHIKYCKSEILIFILGNTFIFHLV